AGLGVTSSLEHSGGPGAQREDVPGPGEVLGAGVGARQQSQGQGAIGCADPRAHADGRIDADGEGGALGVGVGSDHLGQLQLLEPVPGQGHADDAAGVTHSEGQQLLGRGDSREDQVALVLTVLVVDHDHRLSGGEGVQGSIEGVEMNGVHRCICAWAESSVSVCFSRYLASTSTSMLTVDPGLRKPRVVRARVSGISPMVTVSSSTAATVRLTPSTASDPRATT